MDVMRRAISFVVAGGLLLGGLYLLVFLFTQDERISRRGLMICSTLIGLGSWWLWEDFVRPIFRIKGSD
jgi:hypothetical protein